MKGYDNIEHAHVSVFDRGRFISAGVLSFSVLGCAGLDGASNPNTGTFRFKTLLRISKRTSEPFQTSGWNHVPVSHRPGSYRSGTRPACGEVRRLFWHKDGPLTAACEWRFSSRIQRCDDVHRYKNRRSSGRFSQSVYR